MKVALTAANAGAAHDVGASEGGTDLDVSCTMNDKDNEDDYLIELLFGGGTK